MDHLHAAALTADEQKDVLVGLYPGITAPTTHLVLKQYPNTCLTQAVPYVHTWLNFGDTFDKALTREADYEIAHNMLPAGTNTAQAKLDILQNGFAGTMDNYYGFLQSESNAMALSSVSGVTGELSSNHAMLAMTNVGVGDQQHEVVIVGANYTNDNEAIYYYDPATDGIMYNSLFNNSSNFYGYVSL